MKKVVLCIMLCMHFLCGCSSNSSQHADVSNDANYDIGYVDGYKDGYEDAIEKSLNSSDQSDELCSFQVAIASLMYDNEYDVVKKLLEYNRAGVECALKLEFGSKNIDDIIDYLEKLSGTATGTCEICGEPVCADEFVILPDDIACAHGKCISQE